MSEAKLESKGSPRGFMRWVYRAPILMYRAHLGWMLGHRFVMIEHIGRKSGELRQVVLEVVGEEPGAIYLAAAYGSKSHWYQNIQANSEVIVHLGRSKYSAEAEPIDEAEAFRVMSEYGTAHPRTLAGLARFMLDDPGDTVEEQVKNVSDVVPFVRVPKPEV